MNITLNKEQALIKLHENRQFHIDTFQESVEGWQHKMEGFTEELNKWASQTGKRGDRPSEPQQPKDYTKDYDDLIRKLNYHALALVEVTDYEFEQIINNQFGWTGGFLSTNAMYTRN